MHRLILSSFDDLHSSYATIAAYVNARVLLLTNQLLTNQLLTSTSCGEAQWRLQHMHLQEQPFAGIAPLQCSNQAGVYKWLEKMITHHVGTSDAAQGPATAHSGAGEAFNRSC